MDFQELSTYKTGEAGASHYKSHGGPVRARKDYSTGLWASDSDGSLTPPPSPTLSISSSSSDSSYAMSSRDEACNPPLVIRLKKPPPKACLSQNASMGQLSVATQRICPPKKQENPDKSSSFAANGWSQPPSSHQQKKPERPDSFEAFQHRVLEVYQFGSATETQLRKAFCIYGIIQSIQIWISGSHAQCAFVAFYKPAAVERVMATQHPLRGINDVAMKVTLRPLQPHTFKARFAIPPTETQLRERAKAIENGRSKLGLAAEVVERRLELSELQKAGALLEYNHVLQRVVDQIIQETTQMERAEKDARLLEVKAADMNEEIARLEVRRRRMARRSEARRNDIGEEGELLSRYEKEVKELEKRMVPAMWPLVLWMDDLAKKRGAEAKTKDSTLEVAAVPDMRAVS